MMSVRMKRFAQRAALVLGVALLSACGGGGGGSGNGGGLQPPAGALKAGLYEGTITSRVLGQPDAVSNASFVIAPDGEARLLTDDCVQGIGTLQIASGTATGTMHAFAPVTCGGQSVDVSFPDGSKAGPVSFSVSYANNALTGSFTGLGQTGSLQFARNAALSDREASPARVAGNYAITSLPGSALSIDSAGRLSGTDGFGMFDGTVSVLDPALNVYRVAFDYDDGGGAPIHFAGLASLVDTPAGADRGLLVQVNSPLGGTPVYLLTIGFDRQ